MGIVGMESEHKKVPYIKTNLCTVLLDNNNKANGGESKTLIYDYYNTVLYQFQVLVYIG